jgi:hypothetical protein
LQSLGLKKAMNTLEKIRKLTTGDNCLIPVTLLFALYLLQLPLRRVKHPLNLSQIHYLVLKLISRKLIIGDWVGHTQKPNFCCFDRQGLVRLMKANKVEVDWQDCPLFVIQVTRKLWEHHKRAATTSYMEIPINLEIQKDCQSKK